MSITVTALANSVTLISRTEHSASSEDNRGSTRYTRVVCINIFNIIFYVVLMTIKASV